MAEYLVQSESLTAVADKIRTLSGTTAAMGLDDMANNVNAANGVVDNQADLIAQIQGALEGKAGGSSSVVGTYTGTASLASGADDNDMVLYIHYTSPEHSTINLDLSSLRTNETSSVTFTVVQGTIIYSEDFIASHSGGYILTSSVFVPTEDGFSIQLTD